jgi:hypothetical protein
VPVVDFGLAHKYLHNKINKELPWVMYSKS